MICDQIRPLLEAFTAHELGWGTAWRVRRHLAACPACASELAATRRLDTQTRAWRDVPAPAGLQSRIAAALPVAAPATAPRRPVIVRRAAVGLAGLAAAGAAFFWLVPGQPGRPTIAFADVERAMASVNIMTWTDTTKVYDGKGGMTSQGITQIWTRRSPPAFERINMSKPFHVLKSHSLVDLPGLTETLPNGDYVLPLNRNNTPGIVNAHLGFFTAPLANLRNPGSGEKEEVTLDGRRVLKFTLSEHLHRPFPREVTGLPPQCVLVDNHMSVWIDPTTKRVVQMQLLATTGGKLLEERRLTQFHYDETPPPGVFDRPLGAKVRGHL